MSKILSTLVAGLFAATMSAGVLAAEQTKAQEHKGTPAAGTVEKKEQKKDGTGAAVKKDAAPAKSDAAPAKKDAAPTKADTAPAKKDEPKSK